MSAPLENWHWREGDYRGSPLVRRPTWIAPWAWRFIGPLMYLIRGLLLIPIAVISAISIVGLFLYMFWRMLRRPVAQALRRAVLSVRFIAMALLVFGAWGWWLALRHDGEGGSDAMREIGGAIVAGALIGGVILLLEELRDDRQTRRANDREVLVVALSRLTEIPTDEIMKESTTLESPVMHEVSAAFHLVPSPGDRDFNSAMYQAKWGDDGFDEQVKKDLVRAVYRGRSFLLDEMKQL